MEDYPYELEVMNKKGENVTLNVLGLLHSTESEERKVWVVRHGGSLGEVTVMKGTTRQSLKT